MADDCEHKQWTCGKCLEKKAFCDHVFVCADCGYAGRREGHEEDMPTLEEADAILRKAGEDPEDVGKRGAAFVAALLSPQAEDWARSRAQFLMYRLEQEFHVQLNDHDTRLFEAAIAGALQTTYQRGIKSLKGVRQAGINAGAAIKTNRTRVAYRAMCIEISRLLGET